MSKVNEQFGNERRKQRELPSAPITNETESHLMYHSVYEAVQWQTLNVFVSKYEIKLNVFNKLSIYSVTCPR